MRIKCPVAQCGWEGNVKKFPKHIAGYKQKMGEREWKGMKFADSHERWANVYFKATWEKTIPENTKWVLIAREYVQQQKEMARQTLKRKMKGVPANSIGGDIKFENGRVTYNGKQYSPDEFSKIMPGIKMGR